MIDLEHARSRDASDPLREFRDRFIIADPDQCYLDGNSLGRLPAATADAVAPTTTWCRRRSGAATDIAPTTTGRRF